MTINHHLDNATLLSYSAGSLGEALSAVAASHIAGCATCRNALRACDAIGGALLDGIDAAPVKAGDVADAVEDIVSDMCLTTANEATTDPESVSSNSLPAPLRHALNMSLAELPWKRLAPGIKYFPIPLSDGEVGDLRLLNIQPGRRMPEHSHGGSELTLVLDGDYRDKFGRFGPGDIADLDEHVGHQPVVGGQGCVCLVASEQPVRFHGILSRILQPFVGM